MVDVDVKALRTREILRLYAALLEELIERRVVRTRNAPAGDLAETLVAVAYGGTLAPNSEKSWDVAAADGRRLQVKGRLVGPHTGRSQIFSIFRSWDFDACVFVLLDASSYDIGSAVEVPVDVARAKARESSWVSGFRVRVGEDFTGLPGVVDVTSLLRSALENLDSLEGDRGLTSEARPATQPGR